MDKTRKFHKRLPRRLSVSLDEECADLIERLQCKYKISKADIIRKAVCHLKIAEEGGGASPASIKVYLDLLGKGGHVIVDIENLRAMFAEIGGESKEFWKNVREIGENRWNEYHDKGLREVGKILEHGEMTNWYKLNIDSERAFTLIPFDQVAKKFLKNFFEGLFDMSPHKVNITESYGKIRINVMA